MKIMLYNLIKEYYDMGLYTKDQLKVFVQASMITAQQYQEICGEPYITTPANQASAASSQTSAATSTTFSNAPIASTAI